MLYLVIWWIMGLIAIFGGATIHIVKAMMNGYDAAKFWNEYPINNGGATGFIDFMFGLTIWPWRVMEFIEIIPYLYDEYEPLEK